MKFVMLLVSLLCCAILFSQQVSTFVPANSGIDEALFRAPDGTLYGGSWDDGALYAFETGSATLLGDDFTHITEIAAFSNGNLVLCDNFGNAVHQYDPVTGSFSLLTNAIHEPAGVIKMPGVDTMLIATASRRSLFKLAPDGSILPFLNGGLLDSPVTMAFDPIGNLYVGNYYSGKIVKVTPDLDISELCRLSTNSLGHMRRLDNQLFVTGVGSHEIYRVNIEDGSWISWGGSTPGSQNGDLSNATFNAPNGIETSVTGDTIYISDYNTEEIRMITGVKSSSETSDKNKIKAAAPAVYPNPTSGPITIKNKGGTEKLSFILFGICGEKIFSGNTQEGQLLLLPNELSPGIYHLHIFRDKEPIGHYKIIFQP